MTDHVVDTNVFLVASAAEGRGPFHDTHVPEPERTKVLDWLAAFHADETRRLVLDDRMCMYREYLHKLSEQDYGFHVLLAKYQMACWAFPDWDGDSPVVPGDFIRFDPSDKVFLAAALTDPTSISIVNASDSDWLMIESELRAAGVRVIHIIEPWLRATSVAHL